MLDATEYFHLGITASANSDHHKAIEHLKSSLDIDAKNAQAHHLLGAEYAEIGLFDRAIESIETAININPKLEVATFQLGMLYFRFGNSKKTQEVFAPLAENSEIHSIKWYCSGILKVIDGNYIQAKVEISEGLELDEQGSALHQSMSNVFLALKRDLDENLDSSNEDDDQGSRVYLGAYGGRDN